ncbi:MAG: hypothetical protein JSR52_05215 [Planctomycetes bacterium]|nr:hypothetical protein [Planctomycetota bacterium]
MRLWQSLERVQGWAGVRSVWREHMGDELQFLQPLLRPMEELAMSVPWPGTIEGRKVVVHDEDDIVAIDPETCESAPIRRDDIVLWQLDADTLFRGMSSALGLVGTPSSVGMGNRLWWLGELIVADATFAVYLATTRSAADLLRSTAHIAAWSQRPFVLVTPTRSGGSDELDRLLAGREAARLTLDGSLEWLGEGEFRATRSLPDCLESFLARHAPPKATAKQPKKFPTPRGSTWSDVSIRFLGAESAHVTVRGEVRELDPAGMNLLDGRTKKPNFQWQLLHAFGLADGHISWKKGNASKEYQKRKETLAKSLTAFFGIAGEPIVLDGKDWKCCFRVDASDG